MRIALANTIICAFFASIFAHSQTPYWQAQSFQGNVGQYSTAVEACKAAHKNMNGSGAVEPDVFKYTSDIKMVCEKEHPTIPNAILGTDARAYLQCPSGSFFTYDLTGCQNTHEPPQAQSCSAVTNTPLMPLGTADNPSGAGLTETTARPIHISTGAKIERATDFSTADGRLSFQRTFTTRPILGSRMGWGWTHNFERRIQYWGDIQSPTRLRIWLGNEQVATFERVSINGNYEYRPARWRRTYATKWAATASSYRKSPYYTFERQSNGDYHLVHLNGTREVFADTLWLKSIEYPGGYSQTLQWSNGSIASVTDSHGRSLNLTHNSHGILTSLIAPDGQTYNFEYDFLDSQQAVDGMQSTSHRWAGYILKRAVRADGTYTEYHHEYSPMPGYITGITDERGVRVKTTSYAGMRAIASEGVDGKQRYSVASQDNIGSPYKYNVTNPLGQTKVHWYWEIWGHQTPFLVETLANGSVEGGRNYYGISNSQNNRDLDAYNNETLYDRDSKGQPNQITFLSGTPDQYTVSADWHPNYRVPTRIVRPGLTEDMTYDADGLLLSHTATDTSANAGSSNVRTSSYTWLPGGLLRTVDGPLAGAADTITYGYTADGYVNSITDENGHVTTFASHNGRGQPGLITQPNGLQISLTYNNRGWVTSMSEVDGSAQRTTSFAYDAAGNVTRMTLPTGGYVDYVWDGNSWLTSSTSSLGETATYTYDNMGNVTSRTVSGASGVTFSSQSTYDSLGRLLSVINADGATTTYGYNKRDELISITDPTGAVWGRSLDGLGRLIRTVEPDGHDINLDVDTNGDITSHEDGNALTTQFVRNGFGEVVQESGPDRGTLLYSYDAAGRMISMTEADGQTTSYAYDASGRVLSRTFSGHASLDQSFTYDAGGAGAAGFGQLTSISDAFGDTTYTFNRFGDLLSESRTLAGQSYSTSYTYDAAGLLIRVTYPSGRKLDITRDAFGRATSIKTQAVGQSGWTDLATGMSWAPLGPLTGFTSFNGLTNARNHDGSYRLSGFEVKDGATDLLKKTLARDSVGRVTAITDNVDSARNSSFSYANDGRLASATGVWGTKSWAYDGVGNRLSETRSGGASGGEDYIYTSGTNRLSRVEDAATNIVQRDFSYTADGHVSDDTRSGGALAADYDYVYDASNRLSDIRKDGVTLASYGYDAFERRITRAVTGGDYIHYLYDQSGRPLAEHDAVTGLVRKEFIWLGDMLIAMVEAGQTYAVHGGHLGQPLMMTDSTGTVVWDAEFAPFGGALPTVQTQSVDLRFPGQWEQAEAGLIQNWHRDYDPSLGRYLQADPLGLDAGQSLYGYVSGDPLNMVDPTGEFGIGGAIVGVGLETVGQLIENKGRLNCLNYRKIALSGAIGLVGGTLGKRLLKGVKPGMSRFNPAFRRAKELVDRSRFIPGRMGGSYNPWNVRNVWAGDHAKMDPSRYRFVKKSFKPLYTPFSPARRFWERLPSRPMAILGGGAIAARANMQTNETNCECSPS